MTDFGLFLTSAVVVSVVMAITQAVLYWLKHKDDCKHTWSSWQDPVKNEGFPYQLRACTKCNQWQSRNVR